MKFLVLLLFVGAAAALKVNKNFAIRHGLPPARPPNARAAQPTWGTITQKQDNFDPTNTNTWEMRYVENGQFFEPGGPIFIMLGAEWTIDVSWLQSSQMFDMAEIHNAYMYYTEHRYYGESYPTTDLTTENLSYLSVDQALADVAEFIVQMKESDPDFADSKVVIFGGSYGAAMATWMRRKYPDLVHAAVASSAPLLAKVDYHEYHDVIKTDLGKKCASVLMNASKEIRKHINNGNNAKIENDFSLCDPIQTDLDVQALFMYIANTIGGPIQYANSSTVSDICTKLQDDSLDSDYDRLVAFANDGYCRINYESTLDWYTNTSLYNDDSRQWLYQTCTNFGYFQSAWGDDSLYNYGVTVDFYSSQCRDIFGSKFTPQLTDDGVDATNTEHGALDPDVTRVISIHGTVDPWHSMGVKQDINDDSPTYIVTGAAHCQDMFPLDTYDSEEMHEAKQAVVDYVAQWLQDD